MKKTFIHILWIFSFFCLSVCIRYFYVPFRVDYGEHISLYNNTDTIKHIEVDLYIYKNCTIAEHKFLPYHGGWGPFPQVVLRGKGYDLYTSFNSVLFVLPHFFGVETEEGIKVFNLALHFIGAILFYFLICAFLGKIAPCAVIGSILYLFNVNMLHYGYQAYWAHQLGQPFFLGLLALLAWKKKEANLLACSILVFFCCWIVWTGYVLAFGVFLYFLYYKKYLKAFCIAVVSMVTFILSALHFCIIIHFEEYIYYLLERAVSRSGVGCTYNLISYTMIDYGILVFFILLLAFFLKNRKEVLLSLKERIAIFLVASIMVLESIVMINHDWYYGFGRIKYIIPLLLIVSLFVDSLYKQNKKIVFSLTTIFVIINCLYYLLY